MKKKLIIALVITLVCILCTIAYKVCLKYRIIEKHTQDKVIKIDYKKSYYDDFYVKNNKVYINCILSIYNDSKKNQKFYIRAKYSEDVGKLLLNNNYLKINEEAQEKVIELKPKEKQTLNALFEGDFGGKSQKANRLLPSKIQIVHVK